MKFTVASVLALAGAASAATNGPYNVGTAPSGFIKGVLNTTVSCNISALGILPLGAYKLPFGVSAALPDKVAAGQPFNVVAGTRLIVPKSVNGLAYLFGARFYGGKATKVIVNAAGANPSSIDAAKAGLEIPQAPINANGVSVLEIPGAGGTISVGPFTGDAGARIVLSFGDIAATIYTYNATGSRTFITAFAKCPAAQAPTSLAFVNVGKAGSTATLTPPSSLNVGKIVDVPLDSTAGVVGLTYNCDFGDGIIQGPVRISVGGYKPPGDGITLSLGQGNVYLTSTLVNKVKAIVTDAVAVNLRIDSLEILAKNATPSKKNIIPSGGITVNKVPFKADSVVTIPKGAPAKTLGDITFTPSGSGTAYLSLGGVSGQATVVQADGSTSLDVAFTCAALSPPTGLLPYDI